ncbi:MAG TPA: site-specific integrase [Fusibacter sp.]|nr:site-specific integrase [Fusibacter sp.]
MFSGQNNFKFLTLQTQKTKQGGTIYRVKIPKRLGLDKDFYLGLGSDPRVAFNLAYDLDEMIKAQTDKGYLDLDALKNVVQTTKAQKKQPNLMIVKNTQLTELWDNYVNFNQLMGQWTETYIKTHIKTVRSIITDCPCQDVNKKDLILDHFFSDPRRTPKTSKERFKLLVACIEWNARQGNIPRSLGVDYRDLLSSLKINQNKKHNSDIDIFKVNEVYQILSALKNDTYSRFKGKHSQYYEYAYFLWLTGCRPSEAVALKWNNVDLIKNKIKFCEVEIELSGNRLKRDSTKTEKFRIFPVNSELKMMLTELRNNSNIDGYVFTNGKDKPISQQAFRRIFSLVLDKLGINQRIPYQLRHTMISYHANNDFPIQKLASIVGNSEEVIKGSYMNLDIERINLPDVIKP